jgi:hypothetical protein
MSLAVLTWACVAGPEEHDPPPLLNEEGDPCRPARVFCIDEEAALECVDWVWTVRSCEQSCAEIGPAMLSAGCHGPPDEGCACTPEPGACDPGSTACESESEIGHCGAGQVWTVYDCADVCAASLPTPVSLGCDVDDEGVAVCWCGA